MTYALPSLFLFIAKLLLVSAVAFALTARQKIDALGAWLCAWVAVQATLLIVMFAMSLFGALGGQTIWIWLALATIAVIAQASRFSHLLRWSYRPDALTIIAALVITVIVTLLVLKALIFTDTTHDAQSYGIIRVALWMNYRSVFVHMESPEYAVFTYEWCGELIGLSYALVSGNIQGLPFGNVEIFVFCFAAFAWLAVQLGAPRSWALFVGIAIVTSPALLGLAASVKGDLLACGAMAFAVGHVVRFEQKGDTLSAFFLPVGIAIAVGAKLTAATLGAPLAIVGAVLLLKRWRHDVAVAMAAGCALSVVFLLRYLLNAIFYGSPIVHSESSAAGLATLLMNVEWLLRQLIQFAPTPVGDFRRSSNLGGGFGLLSALIVIAILADWARGSRPTSWRIFLVALGGGVTIMMMFIMPYYPWSLRYYLPAVLISVTALLAVPFPLHRMPVKFCLVGACLCGMVLNSAWFMRPGEVWGGRSFGHGLRFALSATPLQRALMESADTPEAYNMGVDLDRRDTPLTFVVLQQSSTSILRVIGSSAQNRLVFALSQDHLLFLTNYVKPDFVVMTKHPAFTLSEQTKLALTALGYAVRGDDRFATTASDPQRHISGLASSRAGNEMR